MEPLATAPRKPLQIGLTGNIAAGKSTVAHWLAQQGCEVIDADSVAHQLYSLRPDLVGLLAQHFGPDILRDDHTLNRQALGERVFGNPEALATLNALVGPALHAELEERMQRALNQGKDMVLDAALIVEWGYAKRFPQVWLVTAPESMREARLLRRPGMTPEVARRRLESQMPESRKRPHATLVLNNDSSPEALLSQVEKAWSELHSTRESGRP
jgi:dephospho-CoA kinase